MNDRERVKLLKLKAVSICVSLFWSPFQSLFPSLFIGALPPSFLLSNSPHATDCLRQENSTFSTLRQPLLIGIVGMSVWGAPIQIFQILRSFMAPLCLLNSTSAGEYKTSTEHTCISKSLSPLYARLSSTLVTTYKSALPTHAHHLTLRLEMVREVELSNFNSSTAETSCFMWYRTSLRTTSSAGNSSEATVPMIMWK